LSVSLGFVWLDIVAADAAVTVSSSRAVVSAQDVCFFMAISLRNIPREGTPYKNWGFRYDLATIRVVSSRTATRRGYIKSPAAKTYSANVRE
jgi:hypothetical protein